MAQQVINYHDVQMYETDIEIFTQNAWLNDNAINFYLMYIYQAVCGASKDWAMLDPAVISFFMLQCDEEDEFQAFVSQFTDKKMVFIPINNTTSSESYGTHWSLLVWDVSSQTFHHFDSSQPLNRNAATQTARRLCPRLAVQEKDCPQQQNGYDCGMHAILVVEYLAKRAFQGATESIDEYITPSRIQQRRQQVPELVKELLK